jgi:quercetin dioxygenase-like cupin family protein
MDVTQKVTLSERTAKGIARSLFDSDLGDAPIRVHISEVAAGQRSHPPHRHDGYEAFYMIEGEGTIEIENDTFTLAANETMVINPQKLHGIANHSDSPIRYMVIITNS